MNQRAIPLAEAIRRFVRPGMHLNFASTPYRSNAAVREVARHFRGTRPEFILSATGFHSTLHLLARLRLGRKYIACFFGDNYPAPRKNSLYQKLLDEGYALENWSLLSYAQALSAAAHGHPYAITNSLANTDLGARLAASGAYRELPDPKDPCQRIGLLEPLTPDIVFLHAAAADSTGQAWFAPPVGEGFYGAYAAKAGVIVTVERRLERERILEHPELSPLAPSRVLAVCEEPFGAHPQPLFFPNDELGYADDFEHYELWRRLATDDAAFKTFERAVLNAVDGGQAYRDFVGLERLAKLRRRHDAGAPPAQNHAEREPARPAASRTLLRADELDASERLIVLGARAITRRVNQSQLSHVLAGIGQSFAASRLAKLLLTTTELGQRLELVVETGFSGFSPERLSPFLLAERNVAAAARLTSIEAALGLLVTGARNACLAVIGAAEVDENGAVNSSFVDGQFLVGSGGASDAASCASEVMVLARAAGRRLVERVEFVTSAGERVRTLVSEDAVLERSSPSSPWTLREQWPGSETTARFAAACHWQFHVPEPPLVRELNEVESAFISDLREAAARGAANEGQT
ncbi:MAG: CoA-transferase [Myxococcota bacterium]